MRYLFTSLSIHLQFLLCLVVLGTSGCRKANRKATSEEAPANPPLRLTLPELPQLPAGSQASRQTVTALLADSQSPFTRAQAQYLHHLAAQNQALELDLREGAATPAAQMAQFADLLLAPPAALIVQLHPNLPKSAHATLSSLREAGVFLIALDPPPEQHPLFDASVSCDPFKIGTTAAALLTQALTQRTADLGQSSVSGRIMSLRGSDADPVCSLIQEGFAEGLKAEKGLVLVHDAPANWSLAEAKARFTEGLRLQHPIDALFAHDDLLAQAVHQVAAEKEVRDDLYLVGVNGFAGSEGGIEMIRTLQLDATCQRPFLVDVAWRLIQRHLAGEPPSAQQHILLAPRPIVPADLDHPETLHPSVDDL